MVVWQRYKCIIVGYKRNPRDLEIARRVSRITNEIPRRSCFHAYFGPITNRPVDIFQFTQRIELVNAIMIEPVRVTVRCVVRAFPDDPLAILIPSGCACLVRFRVFGFHALSVGHGVSRAREREREAWYNSVVTLFCAQPRRVLNLSEGKAAEDFSRSSVLAPVPRQKKGSKK